MRTRLLLVLALGAWGCGQQSLTPGTGMGGAGGGASGTGGCGPARNKLTCPGACSQGTAEPVCLGGVWTCPTYGLACPVCAATIPRGCICDQQTGIVTCAYDAGATDASGGDAGDAGASCPSLGPDAGLVGCTESCGTDVGVPAVCTAGRWQCPRGAFSTALCPPCSLSPPPPPGCMCDPTSGVLACDRDAGAAASGGHGG